MEAKAHAAGRVVALVAAAGSGSRLGGGPPKQFRPLGGRAVLDHCLATLAGHPSVGRLVLVLPPLGSGDWSPPGDGSCYRETPMTVVPGGSSRQESVLRGLEAAAAWSPELVLVHDGARPLVSAGLVRRVIDAAARWGAAVPALPVHESLRGVDSRQRIHRLVEREGLQLVQTPEGFAFDLVLEAARRAAAAGEEADDTVALVRRAGHEVRVVPGERRNLKITGPGDLELAEALLAGEDAHGGFRVGYGYDAHRLVPGRPLRLGGVEVAHHRGLQGHSDGDVLLHALADALLGAAALGDLGRHFPDSDPALAGASSLVILSRTAALVAEAGWRPVNVDAVVVAEEPRLAPHAGPMREAIAGALGLAAAAVSVKATTTEGLGFEGRGEGISASATVLLGRAGEGER